MNNPARVSFVVPVADEPRNETLPLALSSAVRHAAWAVPTLVGSPLLLQPYLVPYPEGHLVPFRHQDPDTPVENTTRMLRAALEDAEVTDPFVWSNDDIFFLGPASIDDVRRLGATARGKLEKMPKAGRYGKQAHAARDLLLAHHLPTWDYERHVPLLVHKGDMRRALDLGLLVNPRSIYQNLRLEAPFEVRDDVKAFTPSELDALLARGELVVSTGDHFPLDVLRAHLS